MVLMRTPGLRRLGKRARRALGQHFLVDAAVIDYETAMARVNGQRVLEIGGGTGNLTVSIARHAKKIITVEKDQSLASMLRSKFAGMKNIEVVEGDFLAFDPDDFEIDVIVGNIPYALSSQILFRLRDWSFDRAVLCVQKEFAERMVAKPGTPDYSRLSVMTQLYFKPIFLKVVPRGCFSPVPEVDSAIVLLTKKGEKVDAGRDKFIERLFSHGKNTVHAALRAKEMKEGYPDAAAVAQRLGLGGRRVFSLSMAELLRLFEEIKK